ncbi:hypothetical protein ACOSQ4_006080 [Xanthoceras sorbifolium]
MAVFSNSVSLFVCSSLAHDDFSIVGYSPEHLNSMDKLIELFDLAYLEEQERLGSHSTSIQTPSLIQAKDSNTITAGNVFRDNHSGWLGGFSLKRGTGTALEAELWGVFVGLTVA